ncbi:MAG: heterodisulfide reductase-related iron-sulfur binding cluster [Thermodesulfobacteriota bacterium]
MDTPPLIDISYFPGCSLATTSRESNQALIQVCNHLGYRLVELSDWNCCGSSSAHCIDANLAFQLACRNLSLAPQGRPLLVACPSCSLRLREAHHRLKTDSAAAGDFMRRWKRPVDTELDIVHFFELMDCKPAPEQQRSLAGLTFVPYYGCMLAQPPALRHQKNYHGLMERLLSAYGAVPLKWPYASRCCGTFLSASKPAVVEPMVSRIIQGALEANAECIVTACAMCHLNLEIRYALPRKIPIFHFSELLAMAFNIQLKPGLFSRHMIDPRPLLRKKKLLG